MRVTRFEDDHCGIVAGQLAKPGLTGLGSISYHRDGFFGVIMWAGRMGRQRTLMHHRGTGMARYRWLCAIGLVLGAVLVAGCDALVITRQQRDVSLEPNNTFQSATPAVPGATGMVRVRGTIQQDDIDVYDLGPMTAGVAD